MNQPTVFRCDGYDLFGATTEAGEEFVVIRLLTDLGIYDVPLMAQHATALGMALAPQ